ncbi:MAG: hypothetical protein AB2A00_09765 [Myxococcota bacterium]
MDGERLVLQEPGGRRGLRYLAMLCLFIGFVVAFVGLLVGMLGSSRVDFNFTAMLVALLPAFLVGRFVATPRVRLRREGHAITGAAHTPLPVGKGVVVVVGEPPRDKNTAPTYQVMHQLGREATVLVELCHDDIAARDFAEALCRFGRWGMEWRAPGGASVEKRACEELDTSLAERFANRPIAPVRRVRELHATLERTASGGYRVRKEGWTLAGVVVGFIILWVMDLLCVGTYALDDGKFVQPFLLVGLGGTACIIVGWVLSWAVRMEVEAAPEGLSRAWLVAGHLRFRRTIPSSHVESVHVEQRASWTVTFAGDGIRIRFGAFPNRDAARYVRYVLCCGLLGRTPEDRSG